MPHDLQLNVGVKHWLLPGIWHRHPWSVRRSSPAPALLENPRAANMAYMLANAALARAIGLPGIRRMNDAADHEISRDGRRSYIPREYGLARLDQLGQGSKSRPALPSVPDIASLMTFRRSRGSCDVSREAAVRKAMPHGRHRAAG